MKERTGFSPIYGIGCYGSALVFLFILIVGAGEAWANHPTARERVRIRADFLESPFYREKEERIGREATKLSESNIERASDMNSSLRGGSEGSGPKD